MPWSSERSKCGHKPGRRQCQACNTELYDDERGCWCPDCKTIRLRMNAIHGEERDRHLMPLVDDADHSRRLARHALRICLETGGEYGYVDSMVLV